MPSKSLAASSIQIKNCRLHMLTILNRVYPDTAETSEVVAIMQSRGFGPLWKRASKELHYLQEIGFTVLVSIVVKGGSHWRITAKGRDFLHGFIKHDGVLDPSLLDDIGEPKEITHA